jgi:hypothetical protein
VISLNSKRSVANYQAGIRKTSVIAIALTALLLASLFALSRLADGQGYGSLLMAVPQSAGAPGLTPDRLEDFIEEEFLLTYEIPKPGAVQAVNKRHTVTAIGTNSHYVGLLGYANLDGGFFTGLAMETKQRHAVLNETAAFQIFGGVRITGQSLKLDGDSWIITGVIQDGDTENANLYIPSSVSGGQAQSVIALLDGTITEAYAKNALKSIGIHDSGFDFINLSRSAGIFTECFAVVLKAALSALLLTLAARARAGLLGRLRFLRSKLGEFYFRELATRYWADFLKSAAGLLLFAGGVAAMLLLSLQVLETCLAWQEVTWITGELVVGDFGQKLIWLRNMQPLCFLLFAACISGIAASLILSLFRRRPIGRRQEYTAGVLYNGKSELA